MTAYHEFRYYSLVHDCEMVRLSVFSERDAEYWMLLPAFGPRKYRHLRAAALEAIDYAIEVKLEPGQIHIPKSDWELSVASVISAERDKRASETRMHGRGADSEEA